MKTKIKNNFYSTFSIFDRKNIIYLFICLGVMSLLSYISTSASYGFDYNLVFNLNQNLYLVILILTITFFSYNLINRLKNKIELITRFKSKEIFYKYILRNIIFLTISLYVISVLLLIVSRTIIHSFIINDTEFFYYNIKCSIYYIWQIIRNGVFLCYIEYTFTYLLLHIKKEFWAHIFLIIAIISILIPFVTYFESSVIRLYSFVTYIGFNDFTSLTREILFCLCSMTVKIFIISELCNACRKIDKDKVIIHIKKMIYLLKKIIVPLTIYIIINIINIRINFVSGIECSAKHIIPLINYKELDFVTFATKCLSLLSYMYMVAKVISIDLDKNHSLIFTRISKVKWLLKKIFMLTVLVLILRLPLYIYAFDLKIILTDLLMYITVLVFLIMYLLSKNRILFILLVINIILIFSLNLNLKIIGIIFSFAFITACFYYISYKNILSN